MMNMFRRQDRKRMAIAKASAYSQRRRTDYQYVHVSPFRSMETKHGVLACCRRRVTSHSIRILSSRWIRYQYPCASLFRSIETWHRTIAYCCRCVKSYSISILPTSLGQPPTPASVCFPWYQELYGRSRHAVFVEARVKASARFPRR